MKNSDLIVIVDKALNRTVSGPRRYPARLSSPGLPHVVVEEGSDGFVSVYGAYETKGDAADALAEVEANGAAGTIVTRKRAVELGLVIP